MFLLKRPRLLSSVKLTICPGVDNTLVITLFKALGISDECSSCWLSTGFSKWVLSLRRPAIELTVDFVFKFPGNYDEIYLVECIVFIEVNVK